MRIRTNVHEQCCHCVKAIIIVKKKKKKKRYASIWRALLTHSARPFASNRKQAHSLNAICEISTTCAKLIIVTWDLELNLPLKTLELEEVKSNASSHVKDIHV